MTFIGSIVSIAKSTNPKQPTRMRLGLIGPGHGVFTKAYFVDVPTAMDPYFKLNARIKVSGSAVDIEGAPHIFVRSFSLLLPEHQ